MILSELGYLCDHSLRQAPTDFNQYWNKPYDVLLLDMKLKDMDGMEILGKVKAGKTQACM